MTDDGEWDAIPGETPIDISGIKVPSVRNRRQLNIVEAANVLQATRKYLGGPINRRTAPFTFVWTLRVHQQMFCDVWKWAGRIRSDPLNLGSEPSLIRDHLAHLLGDLESWSQFGTPLGTQAALLHHRTVTIHPFQNGNGRWARLLANIWLHRAREPLIEWPDKTIGDRSEIREEYLSALKSADNGDYAPLVALQQRYTAQRGAHHGSHG